MGKNLLLKLLIHSKWLQQHEKFRNCCKLSSMFILKIVTGNKGIKKNIGGMKGTFRFDYEFAFSNFRDWGKEHNNGFKTLLDVSIGKNVIFDIGAHIGLCTLPLSRAVDRNGMVYAFEPAEANLNYLRKNIIYNKISNIKVIPCLVGEESKSKVSFFESRLQSVMNSLILYKDNGTFAMTHKRQISLDDFCSKNNIIPDVIKIDVEGGEICVLRGARDILTKHRPVVILSVHPRHLRLMRSSIDDLKQLIKSLRYKITDIDGKMANELLLSEYLLKPV